MNSRTTHRRSRSRAERARAQVGGAVVGAALVLGACSGGSAEVVSPFTEPVAETTVAVDPAPVGSTVDTAPVSSGGPASTVSPTVTAPQGAVTLSPEGPWRLVESAPGVEAPGLVYELMPGLWAWIPVEEDLEAGIGWHLTEADVPVIEAYLQARLVYFRAVNQKPMDLDSSDWATWYLDGGAAYMSVLRPRADRGEYGDLDRGVVLRPEVLGEERSDTGALIVSCTLDGGVILTADGELAEGSSWGVAETPSAYRMSLADGSWKVLEYGSAVGVCGD